MKTTPPTCTTPTLLNTQTRSYTGDNRLKNIDTSTYTVNTEYDDKGNKVWEETVDKASGNRKVVTYWTDTERTYQNCSGTTCTTDREERDILVDGRRHATMIVKNGVETYRYYVTSNLGTTNLVLGEDGAILEESDTNPYGDIRYGSNDPNTTTYYGLHERNDTTGLVDMEARMYDPSNLQFSAPDPMSLYSPNSFLSDPQQMHMYAYGRNNPVRYNDPTGMASKSVKSVVNKVSSSALKTYVKTQSAMISTVISKKTQWSAISGGIQPALPLSAKLLRNSLSENPQDIKITTDNQKDYGMAVDKIKGSNAYKEYKNKVIQNAEKGVMETPGSLGLSGEGTSKDLYYSLNRVGAVSMVEKTEKGFVLNTQISDVYDFAQPTPTTYKGELDRTAVSQAYRDQQSGHIKNYNITINFQELIPYE